MPPLMRMDIVSQPSSAVDEYALGEDDVIVDQATGLPMATWSNLGTVVNKIDVRYDFNESTLQGDFSRRQIYTAEKSVERYTAQPALTAELRGVHTSLGGQAIEDRFALLYLQRWAYPPPILDLSIPFRRHMFEFLDAVRVTHSKIKNPISGKLGLDHELFEIIAVNPQWLTQGRLDLRMVWVGAIETSAVPVASAALSLVPGESSVDATDVNIPFGTSITLTTPGSPCSQIRLGLKALNYRRWRDDWESFVFNEVAKDGTPSCIVSIGTTPSRVLYNAAITYHIDYKKSGAPDAPGTGSDPSTGWVPLQASIVRGNTSLFSSMFCGGYPEPPAEDIWTHYFPTLGGAPSVYNVRISFDSIEHHADPGAFGGACGCDATHIGSALEVDQVRMTGDFIEAIV